jgi:hypothetical protein
VAAAESKSAARILRATRHAIVAAFLACFAFEASAQPVIMYDPPGDAVIRRTDEGNNGPINPAVQRLPDILEMRIGAFAPVTPWADLFSGSWDAAGGFMRFDLVVAGRMNPPGYLDLADEDPSYDPLHFGPNPIFGWIEFDMDANEDTGGELSRPDYRYLGNVGRFGGMPQGAWFANRVAYDSTAFDHDITTAPFVDRSGEEFHLAFIGEDIQQVTVVVEKPGGNPAIFEDGEVWQLSGDLFHRSHGWEPFAFQCPYRSGRYMPVVQLQFAHDIATDRTTITLVYPLTNAASASMIGPDQPVESNDGCDDDQNSIEEALADLQFSAAYASPGDRLDPDFDLIAGWEYEDPSAYLDPTAWRLTALLGTAYPNGMNNDARYIWTDIWPNVRVGDFNGDCDLDAADLALLNDYIASRDGLVGFDEGPPGDGMIRINNFADQFSLFDSNYDGRVRQSDWMLAGDMDLNQLLNANDVDDFVQALLDPGVYTATHNSTSPVLRGDMNCDGRLDAMDIQPFVNRLLGI